MRSSSATGPISRQLGHGGDDGTEVWPSQSNLGADRRIIGEESLDFVVSTPPRAGLLHLRGSFEALKLEINEWACVERRKEKQHQQDKDKGVDAANGYLAWHHKCAGDGVVFNSQPQGS